jgi:nucleotide-binding universal stress UspA family protein
MPQRDGFLVLAATDGSPQARAAMAIALGFPWPRGSRAHAVVAGGGWTGSLAAGELPAPVWAAMTADLERVRRAAERALARRWPGATAAIVPEAPVDAILGTARRLGAGAIVVGSRGHGVLGRLVLGSVSRDVIRRATCPVLVVRGRARAVRHLLVGVDGSPNARRAVALLTRLAPPRGGRVTVMAAVEPVRAPALPLAPAGVRDTLAGAAARETAERQRRGQREATAAAGRLEAAGWAVRTLVRAGQPLAELLAGVAAARADALVLGARGTGGVERLLLGSVVEGALGKATVPLLVVR